MSNTGVTCPEHGAMETCAICGCLYCPECEPYHEEECEEELSEDSE